MTASIACDQDVGDGNGTNPQDVTASVQADGSGTLAINPPSGDAFKEGAFKYTLTVFPQGGAAVASQALAVTVHAAAQAPSATLTADGADADGQISADDQPVALHWTASGGSARLTAEMLPVQAVLEGTTGAGGKLRLHVDPTALTGSQAILHMFDESGAVVVAHWEMDLEAPQAGAVSGSGDSQDPDAVNFASLLGDGLDLSDKFDAQGKGQGRIVLAPAPSGSASILLTAKSKDQRGDATARVSVRVANFNVTLIMEDGTQAPANRRCRLELEPTKAPASDDPKKTDDGAGSGPYDDLFCPSLGLGAEGTDDDSGSGTSSA
jgi:hypothetical protein